MATEPETTDDAYAPPSLSTLSGRRRRSQQGSQAPATPQVPSQALDDDPPAGGLGQPLDESQDLGEPADIAPEPARQPRRRATRATSAATETAGLPVVVSVSPGVKRRLDRERAKALTQGKARRGHLDIIFAALNKADGDGWEKVVAASLPQQARQRFGASRAAPRDREYAGTGPESIYVRMTEEEAAEIDKATVEAKVPDRNKLIAISLNYYLPGRKDRPAQAE